MVRRGQRTAGVVIVAREARRQHFRKEQDIQVHQNHQPKRQPDILCRQIERGTPEHEGIGIPQIGGHENIGPFGDKKDHLQNDCNHQEDHTNLGGISNQCASLPADIQNRQIDAGIIDHLVNNSADGRHVGVDQKAEAGQRHACQQRRAESFGRLCFHNQSNNENN